MSEGENLLAIDVGTQSVRAAVVGVDGDIRGIAQESHEVDSPKPGWAQQQPGAWWSEAVAAIGKVLAETNTAPGSIAAIATCGQMHGPVGVDESGEITTPWVQLWCDKRADEQCARIRTDHNEAALADIAGSWANPAWSGLKVRWIKDHDPEAYSRSRWFLVPKDFINYRLTGQAAADPSEVSGSFLWDCRTDAYSPELAEAVGVDLRRFARVHASHEVVGKVTARAANLTGLLEGTPVVAGGGDFPVSMLGFGIVGEGVTADVTGTSTLIALHHARPLVHPAVQNLRHVVGGWIPFTILDCGGLSMKWCRDLVSSLAGREVSFESLIELAGGIAPGCDGLAFYPYMLGERRRENTSARGGFLGIRLGHGGGHFVRAVMEGVAMAIGRDVSIFRSLGVKVDEVLCVGGGSRNELWNRIKATVLEVPLVLTDEPEAGLKGAALLAAAGAGLVDDPAAEARRRRSAGRTIEPQPEDYPTYRAALAEFIRIYDHMLGFWMGR